MQEYYHSLYLSPHLDDVALSCGGQIFQQTAVGQSVLIVTVTAGNPPETAVSDYAQSLHSRWELLSEATAGRRAEDIVACRILGADYLHWPVPDCIYRCHPVTNEPYYTSDAAIFGPVHSAEMVLVAQLVDLMRRLPPARSVYLPLTLGNHVDHLLTQMAGERHFGRGGWYYEDYPYAQAPGALEAVIPAGSPHWQTKVIPLTTEALQAKFAAIAAFQSQLSTFFNGRSDLEQQVSYYAAQVGGERLWQRRGAIANSRIQYL